MMTTELLSLDFPIAVWWAAGIALAAGLTVLALMLSRLARVRKAVEADTASLGELADGGWPEVSVIVTSDGDAENLDVLLPQILSQDYPGEMEVIVVDNGAGGPSETVVARLQAEHPNLYLTYAPANSRNLSRKKLAITIGVKAARFDCLLLTCGNCRIESALWLRAMARHFRDGKEIVAGYSIPADAAGEPRCRAFARVRADLEWLCPAINGRLWRADGNNLGYTRRLFYENKGFQRSLQLRYGDDDIFIREIATKSNTAVELSEESFVEHFEQNPARSARLDRIHRDFTARYLPGASRRLWAFMSWLWWIMTIGALGAAAAGLPSLVPLAAVTLMLTAIILPIEISWRRTMAALHSRRLCLTVGWLMLVHPLTTLASRLRGRRVKDTNFTWTIEK